MISKSDSLTVPSIGKRLTLLMWLPLYLIVTLASAAIPVAPSLDYTYSIDSPLESTLTQANDQDKRPVHIPEEPASATNEKDLAEEGNAAKTLEDGILGTYLGFAPHQIQLFPQSEVVHFSINLLNKKQISLVILFHSWKSFLA